MNAVKRFLDALWQNKTFYKVLSLLIACAIWVVIASNMSGDIPMEVKEVPVDMDNQTSFITRRGLTVIGDESLFVDVIIEGERLVVGNIEAEDIAVSVDVSSVNGAGSFTLPLVAENLSGRDFAITAISPSTVNLRFDRMVTKRFGVELELEGLSVPEEGYLMEEAVVSPTQVSVTGPDTDIAKIQRCVVRLDQEESLTETTILSSDILLLDQNGDPIDADGLTLDSSQAEVTVPIARTVQLPVKVNFLNMPPNLNQNDIPYTVSNEYITVAGPVDEVDQYSEIVLGYIDFKTLDLGRSYAFDVELPQGFTNVEHLETITVTFDWTDMVAQDFSVTNLSLLNIPNGYDAELLSQQISGVRVIGPTAVMEALTSDDLVAEIDLSKRSVQTGQFKTAATIVAPSKNAVWAVGDYTVVVVVSEGD